MREKSLTVYCNNSYYKYPRLFHDHLYAIDDRRILTVYWINPLTKEEWIKAQFQRWDYLIIDWI